MSGRSAKADRRSAQQPQDAAARGRFVKTLLSVLGVQVITLLLLWLLQSTFSY
ncbi:MAG TPA: hypothetical protein VGQ44_04670 [Gemmatimonadaceae bacterium]|nr:hypothetical protein [Gemmatimonadaceae bacterium]